MACGSCGQKAGASVEYEARSKDKGTQPFPTNAVARIFLAQKGGGSVKEVPKKVA